jgi:hypothetical protein
LTSTSHTFHFSFIGGEKDEIIPDKLDKKNAEHYSDKGSVTDFKEFPGRGHFICGQPGWEEVADYAANWLSQQLAANPSKFSFSS